MTMPATGRESEPAEGPIPMLGFEIPQAARILRMSRAQLYNRIAAGALRPQKDGARTYLTRGELERYAESCNSSPVPRCTGSSA